MDSEKKRDVEKEKGDLMKRRRGSFRVIDRERGKTAAGWPRSQCEQGDWGRKPNEG